MNCPACGRDAFYEGFLERQCWGVGCPLYHPKAAEDHARKYRRPEPPAKADPYEDTWPGVGVHNMTLRGTRGVLAIREEPWSPMWFVEGRLAAIPSRSEVEGLLRSGTMRPWCDGPLAT